MSPKITIKDIAKHCNVSIATVSRALNNNAYISTEIRKKILEYVNDIGWRSNNIRNKISQNDNKNIVIAVCQADTNTDSWRLHKLNQYLQNKGYRPSVIFGHRSETLKQCLQNPPEAVIVLGISDRLDDAVGKLVEAKIKVIGLGEAFKKSCLLISADHAGCARQAVRLLLEQGHQKIGFFAGFGAASHVKELSDIKVKRVYDCAVAIAQTMPGFEFRRDLVSDCFNNLTALEKVLQDDSYSAWITLDSIRYKQISESLLKLNLAFQRKIFALLDNPLMPLLSLNTAFAVADHVNIIGKVGELLEICDIPASGSEILIPYIFN